MKDKRHYYLNWVLIFITGVLLFVLVLIQTGFTFSKTSVLEAIRSQDPKYGEIVFATTLNDRKEVYVFKYGDDLYAPVVLERLGSLWRNSHYYYQDVAQMNMYYTGIRGIAYDFNSMSAQRLNYIDLSLNKDSHCFLVIDEDLDNINVKFESEPTEVPMTKSQNAFYLQSDVDIEAEDSLLIGYKDTQAIKARLITHDPATVIDSVSIGTNTTLNTKKNPLIVPRIQAYAYDDTAYTKIPFIHKDVTRNPIYTVSINKQVPDYATTTQGLVREKDGHTLLTYYHFNDSYLLEVHSVETKTNQYFELSSDTFALISNEINHWLSSLNPPSTRSTIYSIIKTSS